MSWSFYSVFLGVFLRALYIAFELSDFEKLNRVFLLNTPISNLNAGAFLILAGSFFLILGYTVWPGSFKIRHLGFLDGGWNKRRYLILICSLSFMSIFALQHFISVQGGLIGAALSEYRGVAKEITEVKTQGYLRWIISLSGINAMLTFSWIMDKKCDRSKLFSKIIFLQSLLTFLFFNFFVSQRTAIVFIVIQIIAIYYYSNDLKLPKAWTAFGLCCALLLFQLMSDIRESFGSENLNHTEFSLIRALEPAILATNFIDISKTTHIVNAVPEKLPYAYGRTYSTLLLAWIPRSVWPAKPVTNVDNTIGIKVFGAKAYGSGAVPPGLFAELYWNFWYPGVFFGCFIVGALLRKLSSFFRNKMSNGNIRIIYVANFMFLGIAILGSSFTSVMVGLLQTLIPTLIFLRFIISRKALI